MDAPLEITGQAAGKFEIGIRVMNDNGAWVELRAVSAPYKRTSWYAHAWAPDFPADLPRTTLGPSSSRAAIERGMRTWLRTR